MGGVIAALASSLATLSMTSPAFAFQGISLSGINSGNTDSFSIGYRFQVGASNISVDGLGFLDVEQDGLQTAHDVGLWTDTGTLLSQVSVGAGTSAPLVGFFRYATIAPITLTAGQIYRVAGSFQGGTDQYSFDYSGLTIDPAITIVNQSEFGGASLAFPTDLFAPLDGRAIGSNIQFNSAAAVPFEFEPTGGLMVLGGGWLLRRHLKKKKTTKV